MSIMMMVIAFVILFSLLSLNFIQGKQRKGIGSGFDSHVTKKGLLSQALDSVSMSFFYGQNLIRY